MLTGGEPMLRPDLIKETVKRVRAETDASIIVYTAWNQSADDLEDILSVVDGITLTLHARYDTEPFMELNRRILENPTKYEGKSLRLNVFHGVGTGGIDLSMWQVKRDIRWIKDCPLPDDEVFMKVA